MRIGFTLKKIYLLVFVAILTGCGKEDIKVYKVPKEPTVTMPHQQSQEQWKVLGDVPQNWEEKSPSGMRVAQFLVKGNDNSQGEVAVMPMIGLKANKSEILAIWKGQLGQNVIEKSEKVKIGEDEGELYDLSSQQPPNQELPQRILVAMLMKNNVNWFFRIAGTSNLIEQSKSDFIKYLSSIKITISSQSHQEPANKPDGTMSNPLSSVKQDFKVPDGWKPLPPAPMTLSRYEISDGSNSAIISISRLEGDGGGMLPNINRWRGQINLGNISEDELNKRAQKIKFGNSTATVVDYTGKSGTGEQIRMVGIIAPSGSFTMFFKMTGQNDAVEKHKDELIKFVESFRF